MAKQVNPSKSTPLASVKIRTECWGGAMVNGSGDPIHWNNVFMHNTLSVKLNKASIGLPNQPITFTIIRESGETYQTISCTTDTHGYCSATANDLPIDPTLNPDEGGNHWERYTFRAAFPGTEVYAASSWTQRVWLSDSVTPWKALGQAEKLAK